MRPAPLPVVLRGAVQGDQHRQRPGPGGGREADQHGQDDPLVAVAVGGVAVAGADGVPVPGLAVHRLAAVLRHGIVADQRHRAFGPAVPQDEAAQRCRHVQPGPAGLRQDALVAGRMALGQGRDSAEQVGDGAAAGGQDGGEEQHLAAAPGGLGEQGGEFVQQGQGEGRYTVHAGLLARAPRVVVSTPRIPARRPV